MNAFGSMDKPGKPRIFRGFVRKYAHEETAFPGLEACTKFVRIRSKMECVHASASTLGARASGNLPNGASSGRCSGDLRERADTVGLSSGATREGGDEP